MDDLCQHRLEILSKELSYTKDRLAVAERLISDGVVGSDALIRDAELYRIAFSFLENQEWYKVNCHELKRHMKKVIKNYE